MSTKANSEDPDEMQQNINNLHTVTFKAEFH